MGDTLEALSAGALDVEVFTTLESTLRSPTLLIGWKLTPLLFQPPPCHPLPLQCLPLLCLRLPPMCQRRLPLKNGPPPMSGLPLLCQPLKKGPLPQNGLPLKNGQPPLCHRRQP